MQRDRRRSATSLGRYRKGLHARENNVRERSNSTRNQDVFVLAGKTGNVRDKRMTRMSRRLVSNSQDKDKVWVVREPSA